VMSRNKGICDSGSRLTSFVDCLYRSHQLKC
jgi:hypothetical protein